MKTYNEMTKEEKNNLLTALRVKTAHTILQSERDIPFFYQSVAKECGYDLSIDELVLLITNNEVGTYYIQVVGCSNSLDGKPILKIETPTTNDYPFEKYIVTINNK